MRVETPTQLEIPATFNSSVFSVEITPLEVDTANVIGAISNATAQWQLEGDEMFADSSEKISKYLELRGMARRIPHYTNATDVRDINAVPNRLSLQLDTAFATLHALWKNDLQIEKYLELETRQFERKYREWYGTSDNIGERRRLFEKFKSGKKPEEISESEFEAIEMKERRAYCLPTITTASASEPV